MLEKLTTPSGNGNLPGKRAVLLLRQRVVLAEDAFLDLVVWRLPRHLPPCGHHFKYRLAYVVGEVCVLRVDNERGKGDHIHVDGRERAAVFTTPERLFQDFHAEVERWNHEHGRA